MTKDEFQEIKKLLEEISHQTEDIKKMLAIQNIVFRKQALTTINEEYLTTDKRKKIFALFDGKQSTKDIASKVKVSEEAVRIIIEELEKIGAIEIVKKKGKTKYPKKLI